jgi:endonuclease-8
MPEGNEIHRFAERHAAAFAGKKVRVDSPNGGFADADVLNGRTLKSVDAYGKHLGYMFGRDLILHVHLGMYGDFWDGVMPLPPEKGALRLRNNWMELRGAMDCSIYDASKWEKLLARIGPDPLREGSDPKPAFGLIAKSNAPIGILLMDQSVFGGIGNIFRAELLFRAQIHPMRPGKDVAPAAIKNIWRETKTLMRAAMIDRRIVTTKPAERPHKRGTALDSEVHYVYGRKGKECFRCNATIESRTLAGRTAYWCPVCQKE